MQVYLVSKKGCYSATGEYDPNTKKMTVLQGSTVSRMVSYNSKFRGAHAIDKVRDQVVRDDIVTENVEFKSASTAANFVTGVSTNGLIAWKNKEGKSIKEILSL